MLPSQNHPSLRSSIHIRLAFIYPLYLRSTAFAAVLYALQHALWAAPNTPWAPTKMPIEWAPATKRSPVSCWASTTPRYSTAEAADS